MTKWLDHGSILGKIGGYGDKYLNPISWITGGKSTKLTSTVLPEKVNSGLSKVMQPFDYVDQKINPARKIPIVDRVSNIVKAKPGDAAALVAGAYFGGAAALGGGGGGGAAGGAGGAGGGLVSGGGGTAMGGSAGTLGAADSAAASSSLGLTAGDVGAGAAAGGAGDVGGLAAADSAAVDAEGAEPGLTQGYGPAQGASASGSQQYQQQGQQQKKQKPQPTPFSPINGLSEDQYQALVNQATGQIAQSSKTVKTRGATQAAMQRGLAGTHPVDTNGVHIAAIQELNKQIESLGADIKAAKAKRAAKGASA
jgi:hypothetical protein